MAHGPGTWLAEASLWLQWQHNGLGNTVTDSRVDRFSWCCVRDRRSKHLLGSCVHHGCLGLGGLGLKFYFGTDASSNRVYRILG